MNILTFSRTALKNLFSKPATRPYPLQPRQYPERTRGHVDNDMDLCILCGLCARKCPAGAIRVDRGAGTWSIDRFGCIQCSSCVESCPKHSLSMGQTYPDPGPEKRTDTYQKPAAPDKAPEAAPKGETSHA